MGGRNWRLKASFILPSWHIHAIHIVSETLQFDSDRTQKQKNVSQMWSNSCSLQMHTRCGFWWNHANFVTDCLTFKGINTFFLNDGVTSSKLAILDESRYSSGCSRRWAMHSSIFGLLWFRKNKMRWRRSGLCRCMADNAKRVRINKNWTDNFQLYFWSFIKWNITKRHTISFRICVNQWSWSMGSSWQKLLNCETSQYWD